ncbi:hypothetical protein ZIOFF_033216 [Zingiber officinale]|uniref:Uncharacterized protein n=1 Tax=Zingiber officinale TaxID=94328 RepID=A0A8J5L674_ZINOF|nr:hypothetical protein ZIOFF_033216 [Zingiber officinale]
MVVVVVIGRFRLRKPHIIVVVPKMRFNIYQDKSQSYLSVWQCKIVKILSGDGGGHSHGVGCGGCGILITLLKHLSIRNTIQTNFGDDNFFQIAGKEVSFEDARSLASTKWNLDDIDYFVDCHYSEIDDLRYGHGDMVINLDKVEKLLTIGVDAITIFSF